MSVFTRTTRPISRALLWEEHGNGMASNFFPQYIPLFLPPIRHWLLFSFYDAKLPFFSSFYDAKSSRCKKEGVWQWGNRQIIDDFISIKNILELSISTHAWMFHGSLLFINQTNKNLFFATIRYIENMFYFRYYYYKY